MKMQGRTNIYFSAVILLQIWVSSYATTLGRAEQSENLKGHWALENQSTISLSSFLPTAGLSKDQSTRLSKKCVEESHLVVKALLNRTEWGLSMFQASGKLPVDALTNFLIAGAKGVLDEPGEFDQCISSKTPSGISQPQYCSVFLSTVSVIKSDDQLDEEEMFKPPATVEVIKKRNIIAHDNPVDVIIGFCLPSSCNARDLQTAVAVIIGWDKFQLPNQIDKSSFYSIATITHERYCHNKNKINEQSSFDKISISFLILACIIIGLVITSTVHDIWGLVFPISHIDQTFSILVKRESTPMQVLKCFSAVRNVNDWLSVKTATVDEITCLHGLRVLTILLTIFIHTAEGVFVFSRPTHQEKMLKLMSHWILYPFSNSGVLMENCLLMGGILTCTSLLKDLDRKHFNLFRFYFQRYLRLTPLYAMIIFFVAALAGPLGSGPSWNPVQYQSEDCRTYWWSHLLYINNIFPPNLTFCMPETWYSAVDMQLFLLSPFLVVPLWRWPRKSGPVLIFLGFLASIFYTMIIHLKWEVPLVLFFTRASMRKQLPKYFQYYYTRTLNRIPAYLIGIVLAWILNGTKNSKIQIRKSTVLLSWIASGTILAMIVYGPFPYVDEKTAPIIDPVFELVYGVFHSSLWSATLCLIIFLCFHGYGGKLNEFLSSKKFVPISRISYSIYLVNFTLISAYISYSRIPINVDLINLTITFLGMLTFTLILSAFVSICIEIPFRNLEKIILFHPTSPSKLTNNQVGKPSSTPKTTSFLQAKTSKGPKEY